MKVFRGRKFLAVICLTSFFIPFFPLRASTLTSLSDVMTRDKISVASNHTVKFTTPTGVDASTDTMTLTFSSGFDLSALAASGITLSHGVTTGLETSETIAGVAAAGVWGAAISGQTITLTAPTNAAAGEITAGHKVVIGINSITNPSAVNTYTLSIAGTFGDAGGLTIPIFSNDTLSVSATVDASGSGGGGGGGGGGGPQNPGGGPLLSNIVVSEIATSSAKITWTTDVIADSTVDYGTTIQYLAGPAHQAIALLSHSITLSSLIPNTLYHFRVASRDNSNVQNTSGDYTFTTLAESVAPVISHIQIVNITDTGATIQWATDIDASGKVEYGLTENYSTTSSEIGTTKNHHLTLSGLAQQTTYHFRVISQANGKTATSIDRTFVTLADQTPPANVIGFTAEAGEGLIRLNWQNPLDGDFSKVIIMARTDHSPVSINDGRKVYEGSDEAFTDQPLVGGTTYFYTNFALDANGNAASGALADATPIGRIIAPEPEPEKKPEPEQKPEPKPEPKPGSDPQPKPEPEPEKKPGGDTTSTPPLPVFSTPTSPLIDQELPPLHPTFSVGAGTLELTPDARGRLGSGVGQTVLVELSLVGLGSIPETAQIEVGSSRYALTPSPSGNAWAASFIPGLSPGEVPLILSVTFANGKTQLVNRTLLVQTAGHVWEAVLVGQPSKALSGSAVYVHQEKNGTLLRSSVVGKEGTYGFSVPNGVYHLVVKREGYQTAEQEITVDHNWIGTDVSLVPTLKSVSQIFDSKKTVGQNVQAALAEIKPLAQTTLNAVRSPEAQVVAKDVFIPTAITVAVANTTTASSAFSLLNYFQYLFTQPLLLFGRRKRKKWGMIYNALSKRPIDLAVVRLIHAEKNLVIQTRITDGNGRFSFNARPGKYRVEVVKPGYGFPTKFLKGAKTDVDMVDLYHGDLVEVKEATILGFNIPVDPVAPEEMPKKILLKKTLRQIQAVLGWVSVGLVLVALFIHPTWIMAGIAAGQIGLHFLFRRLALPKKPKEWGIIADSVNGQTLGQSIVRIFDKKFNKLLETQVTDKNGKYGFFVGKNIYYVTAERDGYIKYVSPDVDLTQKEEGMIDQRIRLQKRQAAS